LTEETIRIPPDALGLISMKSQVKSLGLVNVSGFHVDPGFDGRLRFSVYNAGPAPVYISRGTRTFLIWFAALDTPTRELYEGHGGRPAFTDRDTMDMEGDVFTPQVLADRMKAFEGTIDNRIDRLERKIGWQHWIGRIIGAAVIGSLVTLGVQWLLADPEPDASPDAPSAIVRDDAPRDLAVLQPSKPQ